MYSQYNYTLNSMWGSLKLKCTNCAMIKAPRSDVSVEAQTRSSLLAIILAAVQ